MSGVEASLRIRVQDFRARYPPFEQRNESLPPFAGTLTAACDYLIPQPVDALPEGAQLPEISGHRVVLVVAVDDLPKPCTDLARASIAFVNLIWPLLIVSFGPTPPLVIRLVSD